MEFGFNSVYICTAELDKLFQTILMSIEKCIFVCRSEKYD